MRPFTLTAAVALLTTAAATAQPHPNLPYTVVSRVSPATGSYSNTEYFYNAYTGQPTAQGYWRTVAPPYPAPVYDPYPPAPAYDPFQPAAVYAPAPPAVSYYTPAYGWPPPPRVLAGRAWR